jgi:hypothetical protein
MKPNVGTLDRILRAALGIVLLYAAFFSGLPLLDGAIFKSLAALVGVVMLVTATLRICPIYNLFGIKTCRV